MSNYWALAANIGMQAEIIKVRDYSCIFEYDILLMLGLVINEKVVSLGGIPSPVEVINWLAAAALETT